MANMVQAEQADGAQEREWVIKAQKGDADAFAKLVHTYWNEIYGICRYFVWDPFEAKDLAQDTCAKMWKAHKRLDPDGNFGAYLTEAARNRCKDWVRQQRRLGVLAWNNIGSLDEVTEEEDSSGTPAIEGIVDPTAIDPEMQAIFRDEVEKAMRQLSNFERCVLSMRFMLGYSRAEIAQTAGCTPQTVGNHERRAVEKFRGYFRGE